MVFKRGLHAPEQTWAEHIADSVVHCVGTSAVTVAGTGLVLWSAMVLGGAAPMALALYAAGLIASFSLSAAYNMTLEPRARARLRRFDHAAIYLLIAGTYTPFALIGIGGGYGIALAAAAWLLALLGVMLKLFFFTRFYRAGFALYLVQGWLAVAAFGPVRDNLSGGVQALLLAGGLTYTAGTLFHTRDDWPFNRAIWHVMVLAASATHFVAVVAVAMAQTT